MTFRAGIYRLHAVTQQLMHRTFEASLEEDEHLIPDFIDREWTVNTEEEYVKMIMEVEAQVSTHYSEKWSRRRHEFAMGSGY
jgi:hypothetical protein